MAKKHKDGGQFDLFTPYIADLPLRDQRETMERPFFSLAKRKRLKPINYKSPNGTVYVNIFPNHKFGMATIWDADILIWAASVLNSMKAQGLNDIPRKLAFQPYDVLKLFRGIPEGINTSSFEMRLDGSNPPPLAPTFGQRVPPKNASLAG